MAENKTKPTGVSVDAFLDGVADPQRRADAHKVRALMERLSGEPAAMWGPSIVGFGSYHYKYDSGREGDMARIGFSPRAKELVLYGLGVSRRPALMERLGKHKTGKGCLYIKRLAEVDEAVLEQLVTEALAETPGGG
jgi:Domain of unknown function (DU1801)